MFNNFIDFIIGFADKFRFWIVVNEYERGIILRFGKFNREIGPGPHLKWFGFETDLIECTSISTENLVPQTLTTQDKVSVVVIAIIKYQIHNVKPYFLEVYQTKDVLCDVAAGAVKDVVNTSTFDNLSSNSRQLETDTLALIRKEVNQYGFKIHKVTFSTIGKIRTLRLIQDTIVLPHREDE